MKTDPRINIQTGDITSVQTDAIVNAANSSLLGGGGVDGAIHRAAGPSLLQECREIRNNSYRNGLPAGEAVATGAGALPCRYVIHTVGPVWHGGNDGEEATLESCYKTCLKKASELNCESIAFPAISTGVYGFPKDKAAVIAYKSVIEYLDSTKSALKVVFVFFNRQDQEIFLVSNRIKS